MYKQYKIYNFLCMTNKLSEIFSYDLIKELKETYLTNNTIKSKALIKKSVFNKFPEFYNIYKQYFSEDEFREILYCILKDIPNIPKCKNPNCNNNTKLRNFKIGFQQCCCKKCTSEYQHFSKEHSEKCKQGALRHYSTIHKVDSYTESMNCDYSKPNYYIFKNYCIHGNISVYKTTANKIHEYNNGTFCIQCNKKLIDTYLPTEKEINEFRKIFPEFYKKYSHNMNYKWWLIYFPKYYKILLTYFEKYIEPYNDNIDMKEVYYQFMHDLKGRPHCCMCNTEVSFSPTANEYRKFCDKHLYGFNKSSQEIELGKFIDLLNINVIKNTQNVIHGELDFYFPNNNIAIEYNGCWWHSDKFKEKEYHYNKWKQCKEKGIQLIFIWEDDLLYKRDIVYSLIKSKLGIYDTRIYARKTIIKEVPYTITKEFINKNYLQGYSIDKIRLGLYYNNELVSIMTFGKSRFKSDNDDIEIIRFCNKLNYQIIGGASKLFSYFKKYYNYKNIISYVECDISNGKLYEKLGMSYISRSDNWKWMYKGIRYNRLNKIKNSIHKQNLVKCYSAGILKYKF